MVGQATVRHDGRSAVLSAIAQALHHNERAASDDPRSTVAQQSTASPVQDSEVPVNGSALVGTFSAQLVLLGGSANVLEDPAACAAEIARQLELRGMQKITVQSAPLALDVARRLSGIEVQIAGQAPVAKLEDCKVSLLQATALLADSGSALVINSNSGDRALPYVARVCFIVATMERLHPSLSNAALSQLHAAAQSKAAGEAVIITGPSRTADIEKVLILGAHGPEEVHIYLMRNSSP